MDDNLKKTIEISTLFYLYKDLLTNKQNKYFELYVDEDLSLQEIASQFNVSRNAVFDSITKTTDILFNFEKQLKLKSKSEKINSILKKYESNQNSEIQQLIKELQKEL